MLQYNELVILLSPRGKRKLFRLEEGKRHESQDGFLLSDDLLNADYGDEVYTNLGYPFRLQKPQLHDLIMGIKRQTQIMYPKDMAYILMKLSAGEGRTILEAGSGSGGFTIALSWTSGKTGVIHSFEAREEFHKLAKRNVAWAGVGENVKFHHRDIANGFGIDDPNILNGEKADALFLDVRTPQDYLDHALEALKPGAPIAFLLPTVDQVSTLLFALEKKDFEETEVCEVLVRPWKPVPDRLRPADRMAAHTGFLVFTRNQKRTAVWDSFMKLGTRERKQEAARRERLGLDNNVETDSE